MSFLILLMAFFAESSTYCSSNSGCPSGQICERERLPFGGRSSEGMCVSDPFGSSPDLWGRCHSNFNCRSNETCEDGTCVEDFGGVRCTFDSDCGSGYTCDRWGSTASCSWVGFEDEDSSSNDNDYDYTPTPEEPSNPPRVEEPEQSYAAYNRCMRRNRAVKPVEARIDLCRHLFP